MSLGRCGTAESLLHSTFLFVARGNLLADPLVWL